MGEIHSLARLGELRPPKHLVNCTQYYVSTPTILSIKLFPNCNISFMMDQSTNKTTNEWLLEVAYGKTCPTLGALLFAWQQNHSVGCTKRTNILLANLVCFDVQCLPRSAPIFKNSPNFRHFDYLVLNLHIFFFFFLFFFHQLLLVYFSFCFLLLWSIFLHLMKKIFCQKRLCFIVSLCFVI